MTRILGLGRLEDGGNVNCLKEIIMPGYGMGYGKKNDERQKEKKADDSTETHGFS